MRVRIAFTVEIDADQWRSYYDMPNATAADIRADLNEVAENLLHDDLADTRCVR